jgi:lactate dehydrogenase-like 2-hydroxyacid dehydrogenase
MKILVTRRLPAAVLSRLQTVGTVDLRNEDGPMPAEEFRARIAGKDAAVTMLTDQVDKDAIDRGTALKLVANVAVGYNNIDVAYAASRGVLVTNTPDVLTETVADFTWALMLSLTRRVSEGERLIRSGGWKGWAFDFMLGTDLRGKQLGLVGFGRIARAVARKAAAFGVKVAYSSRRDLNEEGAEFMSLDRLLNTSDIVSLHVPLSSETHYLIDKRALARMKRSAYLINTSRGPVVEEAALVWALEQRLIAGAALDVYEHEPAIEPGLLKLENVLLVPHLGSGTTETRTAMADLAARNVVEVLSGRAPLTPVSA